MNNDLISREALKKALHNFFDGKVIDEPAYILRDVFYHIDNAPAVEPLERIGSICEENCGYRPQGEWIANPLGDYVCNKCSWVVGKFERNFCPNCGAKMRKGGTE